MLNKLREDAPHVLIYPAIGMDPHTNRLAALRLAPIQCAGWGHPVTTGLPSIDFLLFNEMFAGQNAQDEFTEKLIQLPGWGSYYSPPADTTLTQTLAEYGVKMDAVRFLCLQTLHKYLPQYDEILPRIAMNVPNAQFLFARKGTAMAKKLEARLHACFLKFGLRAENYVTFLPELNASEYLGLCSIGEVNLDTPLNSGLTTTIESLEVGCVAVAFSASRPMRARQTAGLLSALGVTETIANSLDEYVSIASRLATDSQWRQTISKRILENKHRLHKDENVCRALEAFLIDAVEKLPE